MSKNRVLGLPFNFLTSRWIAALAVLVICCGVSRAGELPPLKLMSPLSSVSLGGLAGEADAAYASQRFKAAEEGFLSVLELDPGNRRAMFRLGNIYQQMGKADQAVSFYRQASAASEFSQVVDEFAEKALINIALLASDQLRSALDELEKRHPLTSNASTAQRLIDDLSDGQSILAKRVAQMKKSIVPSKPTGEVAPPELIKGNSSQVNSSGENIVNKTQPAPRVTYNQPADPSKDLTQITYIKGAPVKVAKPKEQTKTRKLSRRLAKQGLDVE
jgi:tetratricopeptide (TPR) repeat protein